jgi:4a-hydroxytetrahydrobiopterin dehydratase
MDLAKKKCVPCEVGTPPFTRAQIEEYMKMLKNPWETVEDKKIRREFKFKKYFDGVKFAYRVAELAEKEGHHPNLHIYYTRVVIELSTHNIGGLSENDFIMASKIDLLA